MTPQTVLSMIADELRIEKSCFESDWEWKERVILSACGAWLLHILANSNEFKMSVNSAKNKIKEKLGAYLDLFFPFEINNINEKLISNIADYIVEKYCAAGCLYRTPYYIYLAVETIRLVDGLEWIRSPVSIEGCSFSGLGIYRKHINKQCCYEDLYRVYGLPVQDTPTTILERFVTKLNRCPRQNNSTCEYLNVYRKYGENYYSIEPPYKEGILLAREPLENSSLRKYKLIDQDSQYEFQAWEQEESYHNYVALALMKQRSSLNVKATVDKQLVALQLSHILPDQEEAFLRLYSWPKSFNCLENRWSFSLTPMVYPAIKERLKYLGFYVMEVQR